MARRVSKTDMRQTEIQKMILSMSGKYTAYEIFMDWIECTSLAISNSLRLNHDRIWKKNEEEYFRIRSKYSEAEFDRFPEMLAWLIEELENSPRDVLGEVFMKSGMGSDAGGQFFTPFHVSELMARLGTEVPDDELIRMTEPSCGSGGSIIAVACLLKEKGINYQRRMKVVAQDLDWRCVYMCHVQCTYLGINALCVQGDTLCDPYRKGYPKERVLYTPAAMGVLV